MAESLQEPLANASQRTGQRAKHREQVGWYFYDWANSAFSTTVAGVFLAPYLTAIAKSAADADNYVYLFGFPIFADSLYPYTVSLSVVLQVLFLPILGAIADYSRLRKSLFGLFAYIGSFATVSMFFIQGNLYWLGSLLFLIANLSFGASVVFYNAFLPDIADANERDRVSSQGWALGYLGGGLLLLFNLLFVQAGADALGISTGLAVRISLASAGVWWAIFTLLPLARLRTRQPAKKLAAGEGYVSAGFRQLLGTLRELPKYPHTLFFLIAYLFYNDGIQTVIAQSSQFGSEELKMDPGALAMLFLMVQFIAFFGALFFNIVANRVGAKRAIWISLLIWFGVAVYAYTPWLASQTQFFALGAVIAVVLGGSQALSRSLFSQMIPAGREAEYFGLYEISERGTSWMGPLLFGLSLQLTGNYRIAILTVAVFFVIGIILLPFVDVRRAIAEAGNKVPERV
jgi:UMF1 family MFS transporter